MQRVVVLGAGVTGLSASLALLERFTGKIDLTVMADKFSPHTTSDKAGSIILLPTELKSQNGKNPAVTEETQRWAKTTFHKLHSIYRSKENSEVQICLQNGYLFMDSPLPDPWYKDEVFGFRHVKLDSLEAKLFNVPSDCTDVWTFETYTVRPTLYLSWLTEKIKEKGANFVQKRISSLDELSSYDIIINCTGLGSCELVGDKVLHPVQGQMVSVRAPWVKHWLTDYRQGHYTSIVPRSTDIALGGTAKPGNWIETPDPQVTEQILRNCQEFVPSLSGAEVVDVWAGLRPFRAPIRLESCPGAGGSLIVHCYGHGGQGMILSWGCAQEIGDIVQKRISQ